MAQEKEPEQAAYPIGRGYGHDYMRGGEVLGGYGYSSRPEYRRRRGERDLPADDPGPPTSEPRPGSGH